MKNKILKTGLILMSTITLSTVLLPTVTFATDLNTSYNIEENTFESFSIKDKSGIDYFVDYSIEENLVITTITSNEGVYISTYDKISNHTTIQSDYMDNEEISSIEEDINNDGVTNNVSELDRGITTRAQTGKWVWSAWQNRKLTTNGKFTVQAVISLIGSNFGIYGNSASTLANIVIQYNLRTGYWSYRAGTRRDTNPNYVWTKGQVRLYKDSSRKNLLSTKESGATMNRVY